jgi:hypothetical protein
MTVSIYIMCTMCQNSMLKSHTSRENENCFRINNQVYILFGLLFNTRKARKRSCFQEADVPDASFFALGGKTI